MYMLKPGLWSGRSTRKLPVACCGDVIGGKHAFQAQFLRRNGLRRADRRSMLVAWNQVGLGLR
jgi:hypothetical protein